MQITRERLHQLAWAIPPREVAAELGVTTTELEVLLDTLDVPFPYSGYWRGVSAKETRPRKLPRAKPGTPSAVEITPAIPSRASPARRTDAAKADEHPTEGWEPWASADQASDARSSIPDTAPAVPSRLINPHRIIVARREEEKRRESGFGGWRPAKPSPRELEISRRSRIIESLLFNALEKAGHKVEVERGSLYQVRFVVRQQIVTHSIRERYTQKRRPLNAEELMDPCNVQMGRATTIDRMMTGQPILSADARGVWPKVEWKDKPHLPLELQIDAMVEGLEAVAHRAAEFEARRREDERRHREEQSRREEARRFAKLDANQWRRFRKLAARSQEAQRLEAFIGELRARATSTGDEAAEVLDWISWAETKLEEWHPGLRSIEALMRHVRATSVDDEADTD